MAAKSDELETLSDSSILVEIPHDGAVDPTVDARTVSAAHAWEALASGLTPVEGVPALPAYPREPSHSASVGAVAYTLSPMATIAPPAQHAKAPGSAMMMGAGAVLLLGIAIGSAFGGGSKATKATATTTTTTTLSQTAPEKHVFAPHMTELVREVHQKALPPQPAQPAPAAATPPPQDPPRALVVAPIKAKSAPAPAPAKPSRPASGPKNDLSDFL